MGVRVGRWVGRVIWALLLLVWLVPTRADAQACPASRFCFYVPPGLPLEGSHSGGSTRMFDIVLSAPVKTVTGTYAVAGAAPQRFSVSPGMSFRIPLPGASGPASAYGQAEQRGVFLVADSQDLTVDHREVFDSEQYSETIKRHSIALGTRFRLAGYALNREGRPQAGVDAALIYAPTGGSVTLRAPPGVTLPFWSGGPGAEISVTLAEGQTVALRTLVGRDLDGALLTSTRPVAVSSGGRGWSMASCGDDGMDGLVPVSALGTEYVVRLPTGSATANNESRVRVIADADDTEVRINGALVATLAAGTYHNFQPTAVSHVVTSKPALVWMNGSIAGCELETALIPPIAFAPALTSLSLDFNVLASNQMPPAELAVLIATRDVASIRLDGAAPSLTSNVLVPGRADLSYVRFNIVAGDKNVRAASDFQAMLASRTAPSGLLAYYNPFRIPGCGDSGADSGEGCDDGNLNDADGCSSTCQIESGFVCRDTPSVCSTVCGDGEIGPPVERCDDGNAVAGDGCNSTCRVELRITAPPDGSATTDATPTVSGTADPEASVRVAVGDSMGTVSADAEGAWTYTPAAPVADGMRVITATATDQRGGTSAAMRTVVIDTGTVLTIDMPRPDALIADATPTFAGTGELGSTVDVRIDGQSIGMAMVQSDRRWTFTPSAPLAAGIRQVTALATDALANTISTTPVSFTIDDSATVTINAPASGEVLTSGMLRASGTGEPGAAIALEVRDASGSVQRADAVADAEGQWTASLTNTLVNGEATATATATDMLGNVARAEVAFRVDATTLVTITEPAAEAVIRSATPAFRGAGEAGARVVLQVDGVEVASAIVDADGNFSALPAQALGEGRHVLRADATDEGGASARAEHAFTVDTTTTVDFSQPIVGAVLDVATPELSGGGEPGASVEVTIEGAVVGTTRIGPDGRWTLPLSDPLRDGSHTVEVRTSDAAGNEARSTRSFSVDTRRLALHNPPDGTRISEGRPVITGVAQRGAYVSVVIDGVLVDTIIAAASGSWAMQLISPLADGPHTVQVTTTSDQRVISDDVHSFVLDPAATPLGVAQPAEGSVQTDATPTLAGTSQPGARLAVFVGAAPVGEVSTAADGTWSIDVVEPLRDGSHVARAVLLDGAADAPAAAAGFHLDTQTRVSVVAPADAATIGSVTPVIVGRGEPGAIVDVVLDGTPQATVDVGLGGTWSVALTSALGAGAHRVEARITDALGNVASTAVGFLLDPAIVDSDGDGRADAEECGASVSPCADTDGDGSADAQDADDDGDGIPTAIECATLPCPDTDGDTRPDAYDDDDDDDGRPSLEERASDGGPRDTDRDGVPDHLDPDDDGDSVRTRDECPAAPCPDTSGNGVPDFLSPDDDNDGLPTARELADGERAGLDINGDFDGDGIVNWRDLDANGNGVADGIEGFADADRNGISDYVERATASPEIDLTEGEDSYGVAGGSGCSASKRTGDLTLLLLVGLALARVRRRRRAVLP